MKRKFRVIFTFFVVSLGMVTLAYAYSPLKLFLNGQELKFDGSLKINGGRVFVPLRVIVESLGAKVEWKTEKNEVNIISDKIEPAQQSRILRLEQALAPKDPLSAATIWAEGVKTRNGALQFAVMDPNLKKLKYAEFVEANWSTGTSSPWVESFNVIEKDKLDNSTYRYEVSFNYTDSTKSTFTDKQYLIIKKNNDNWFVSSISQYLSGLNQNKRK